MSDKEHLVRIEAKMDAGFKSVNDHLIVISERQGENKGKIDGHSTQLSWLWGLLATGMVGGILSLIRSII